MTQEGTSSSMQSYVSTFNFTTQSKEILLTKYMYDIQYKIVVPAKGIHQKNKLLNKI